MLLYKGLRPTIVACSAPRRHYTTDTRSRLEPLLYVLLTLLHTLALIAITSALCTLHQLRLSLHTSYHHRRPAGRKISSAPLRPRSAAGLPASAATSLVITTRSLALPLGKITRSKLSVGQQIAPCKRSVTEVDPGPFKPTLHRPGSDLNDPVALTQWSGGDQKSFALT